MKRLLIAVVAVILLLVTGLSTAYAARLPLTVSGLYVYTESRCSNDAVRMEKAKKSIELTPPLGCVGRRYELTAFGPAGQVVAVASGTLTAGMTTVPFDENGFGSVKGGAITIGTWGMPTTWS